MPSRTHPSLVFTLLVSLLASALLPAQVEAADSGRGPFKCQDGAYPWCVHTPPGMEEGGKKWPTILFLPGSGARGSLSNAASLATYDGVGKIISRSPSSGLASTKFITIIPIAPSGSRHFQPPKIRAVLESAFASYPQIDQDRVVVTGYSMGSRGTWRNLVFNTDLFAAGAPSAGAPEKAGDGTLQQEQAPATWPLLGKLKHMPIRAFAGTSDSTAGHATSEEAEKVLKGLGDAGATLTLEQGATHEMMSTKPWEDDSLFEWFLQQSRSGSSSTSTGEGGEGEGEGSDGEGSDGGQGEGSTGEGEGSTGEGEGSTGEGADEGDDDDCDDEGETGGDDSTGSTGSQGGDGGEATSGGDDADDCDDGDTAGAEGEDGSPSDDSTGSSSSTATASASASASSSASASASTSSSSGGESKGKGHGLSTSGASDPGSDSESGYGSKPSSEHGSSGGHRRPNRAHHARKSNDTVTRMARHRRPQARAFAHAHAHHRRATHAHAHGGHVVRPRTAHVEREGLFEEDQRAPRMQRERRERRAAAEVFDHGGLAHGPKFGS